tara:strand:+ start:1080 stop:3224 length:2145 start_codon:yes stop_codon:yes gene_type:complete
MQSNIDKISLPEPDFLENLNSQQKEAVTNIDGPLLVLSGAGTGKTRVLTTRLANIIFNKKAKISEILSVTFTNKAALEMKQRVEKILKFPIEGMYIGTFHSIGVKILRKHAELLNLKSDFTILDKEDQLRLIKQVLSSMNLDTKNYVPKNFLYMIDHMKNLGFSPNEISNHEFEIKSNGKLSEIYSFYQQRLKNFNSVDFGDLILLPLILLRKNKDILEFYSNKFKYILVDEYQDTNSTQYMLLRLLAGVKKNICCVGDEDQSIYGWRGAQLKNILNFEKDFENAKIVRLEQNYRSTANILGAATSLISENKERIGKKLWTIDKMGKPVEIINIDNDELEASFICNKISEFQNLGIKLSNIAILTRASFQFKDLEDRFIKESIKYRVVGGLRFYERKEIKDAIAYFRLLVNKLDNLSLERVINVPKRSIGPSTLKKLYEISKREKISLFDAIKFSISENVFTNKTNENLNQFSLIIEKYTSMLETTDHSEVAGSLLDDCGYTEMLQKEKSPESEGRLENLKKLVIDIRNRNSLSDFLEEVSLLTDTIDNNLNLEKVSLMTLHSAKGLEFDYVFLPGWEEGIFPNQRNIDEYGAKGLEEERRLGYVGITRARKNLIISYVNFRKQYNYSFYRSLPSRFISELPKKNCKLLVSEEKKAEKQKLVNYSSIDFSIGDNVFHSEFGKGQVLGINDNKLQIRFKSNSEIIKIFSDFVKKI